MLYDAERDLLVVYRLQLTIRVAFCVCVQFQHQHQRPPTQLPLCVIRCQAISSSWTLFCIRQSLLQRRAAVSRHWSAAYTTTTMTAVVVLRRPACCGSTTTSRTGDGQWPAVRAATCLPPATVYHRRSWRLVLKDQDSRPRRAFKTRRSTVLVHRPRTTQLHCRGRCVSLVQFYFSLAPAMHQSLLPIRASVEMTHLYTRGHGVREQQLTGSRQISVEFRLSWTTRQRLTFLQATEAFS